VVDGPGAGETFEDSLVFPKLLQSRLRSNVGRKVLGRLTQAPAKNGQNPAWDLEPATSADIAAAQAYLAKRVFVTPNGAAGAEPPF
jgi:hypothetical protein